jgi:tRNA A-37 threonylcarbamoyl transferase component Bud32
MSILGHQHSSFATRALHELLATRSVYGAEFDVSIHAPIIDFNDPEQTQLGRYRLLGQLGVGGMGIVYRAREVDLERDVALKVLGTHFGVDEEAKARFFREAKSAARLHHPNIVPVFEIDQVDDIVFFTMALIEGETLAQKIDVIGPVDEQTAARWLLPIVEAIDYAHRLDVLHLDIKPANILLAADEKTQLSDFGIAERLSQENSTAKSEENLPGDSRVLAGTPSFMAPEQASEQACLSRATDIYSLGATLFYLLTGRPVFAGGSVQSVLQKLKTEAAQNVRLVAATVSKDMAAICAKCLQKHPQDRYPDAKALARDLSALLESKPVSARQIGIIERSWRWAKRERPLAALGMIAFVAMVSGTTISLVQSRHAQKQQGIAELQTQVAIRERAQAVAANIASDAMVEQFIELTVDLTQKGKPISADTLLDYLEKGVHHQSPMSVQRAKLLQLLHFTAIAGDSVRNQRVYQRLVPLMDDATPDQRKKFEDFGAVYAEQTLAAPNANPTASTQGLPIAEMIVLTKRIRAAKQAGNTALAGELLAEGAALLANHPDPMLKPLALAQQMSSALYSADFERTRQLASKLRQEMDSAGLRDSPLHRLAFRNEILSALLTGDLELTESEILAAESRIGALADATQTSGNALNLAEINYFRGMLSALTGDRETARAKLGAAKAILCTEGAPPSQECGNTLRALLIVSGASDAHSLACASAHCAKLRALFAADSVAKAQVLLSELYPMGEQGLTPFLHLNELYLLHKMHARDPLKRAIAEHVAKLATSPKLPQKSTYRRWLAQARVARSSG